MDPKKTAETLHPLERKLLPVLVKEQDFSKAVKKSDLSLVEATRALQWLGNKKLVEVQEEETEVVNLEKNGKEYKKTGLPEKQFLEAIKSKPLDLKNIEKKSSLTKQELQASIGTLRKQKAITIQEGPMFSITKEGEELLKKQTPEEDFLNKTFPLNYDSLKKEEKKVLNELQKRKDILLIEKSKKKTVTLTALGKKVSKQKLDTQVTGRLSSSMLTSGSWKKQNFRSYDLKAEVPPLHKGQKHFVNQVIDYVKQIWLDMGFKEMTGPLAHTAFWDLDALFVPQDHPAREMQDTFYLANPSQGKLPKKIFEKVKKTHESGGDTSSKGWRYPFSEEESKRLLLRTHTTVLSAQTLSKLKEEDLPAKFFTVGKVFRNETLDWKHLFEFYQVDGIVIDPNANLRHLIGYLKQFYKKMGYSDVRVRPAHFPYTEPSLEVEVLHPTRNEWIELGGAGIFRPEVTIPLLGKDVPVLAWGQGLGRIILPYWNITDLRDLYRNDLAQLREMKTFMSR